MLCEFEGGRTPRMPPLNPPLIMLYRVAHKAKKLHVYVYIDILGWIIVTFRIFLRYYHV